MDWFLYDGDLRQESVFLRYFSTAVKLEKNSNSRMTELHTALLDTDRRFSAVYSV